MRRNLGHITWITIHIAVVAAYLAWRTYTEFDIVIIAVNGVCVVLHLLAMAATERAEVDQ